MRFLSLILITCIITLSSMVTVKTVQAKTNTDDCCRKMAGKPSCNNMPSSDQNKGCDKPGCAMMFNCGICGFVAVEQLKLTCPNSITVSKPISVFEIGDLRTYHLTDWKPPKTC